MSLEDGSALGPYEIVSFLGSGGMGEVYKARDTRLRRTVAIKVCAAGFGDQFEREARAIAALNHPNICTIHDIGPNYLVMEFVEGKPLRGPMPAVQALQLAMQLANALSAAHERGIVHRDLKPGNILVTGNSVKLLDFGLAKMAPLIGADDATVTASASGLIVGTVAYMSPEQAQGLPVDARSDIFSFGLVLYEILAGRQAFAASTAVATIAAILRDEPPPLQVGPALELVLARCLRKDPGARFQTAAELKEAIQTAALEVSASELPSVAVLPFANMSGDPENEYFSDGLAEEIINALSRFGGLRVIARTSAFAFKGRNQDVRQIAQILGVTNVLEGGVRRAGDRVRITAQLIAASDGSQLWAQRFDRNMTDIFAVQDEISEAITGALQVRLLSKPSPRPLHTVDLEAYEMNLEGRFHLFQWSKSASERARLCFESAIRLDPRYAAPNASLAEYYFYQGMYLNVRPRDVLPAALAAAERAVELDDRNPEAHMARGMVRALYLFNWTGAKDDFERALELNPKSGLASARRCVYFWCLKGRFEEGLLDARRGLQLDPLNPGVRAAEAFTLGMAQRFDEAAACARPITQAYPSYWNGWYLLGFALALAGRLDDAETAVRKGAAAEALPQLDGLLAYIHGLKGERSKAELIRGLLEETAGREFVSSQTLALASAGCEDTGRFYFWLEKGIEEREHSSLCALRLPLFPGHLADPRCQGLLHKAGLA